MWSPLCWICMFSAYPCGFSQPNVNVMLPWSPNCQNVCVKKKCCAFWHLLQIFCWWSDMTEISKSHKNLLYYHSSRECSLALIHKCTSTILKNELCRTLVCITGSHFPTILKVHCDVFTWLSSQLVMLPFIAHFLH